jgi:hypothetical protein
VLDTGRPFGAAIDPNPRRDPATAPTLYYGSGYGAQQGIFRSTDWGVSWTHYDVLNGANNVTSLDIDPYDGQHLLAGLHEGEGVVESTNGGVTWRLANSVNGMGRGLDPSFVDTGSAATTRLTWVTIASVECNSGCGTDGMWQTENAGASWTQVEGLEHGHAGVQMFRAGPGVIYATGVYGWDGWGVFRSIDSGKTWRNMLTHNSGLSGVTGTPNFLYAWAGGALQSTIDPGFTRASRNPGTTWTSMTATPAAMTNGPSMTAVTYDGAHYILVSGNYLAGIWRYVEP